ncbi:hypothetical protein Sjap_013636 [Stephania japonica]|uniref:Uncharacterized protein n=1 Tax=Stephania japonica TaxID=461633 RepID=A0AAP0IYC8_9MAGN
MAAHAKGEFVHASERTRRRLSDMAVANSLELLCVTRWRGVVLPTRGDMGTCWTDTWRIGRAHWRIYGIRTARSQREHTVISGVFWFLRTQQAPRRG